MARASSGRRRRLHHGFALAAGLFGSGDLDLLELGGNQIEDLGDVFAHQARLAAAIGAVRSRIEGAVLGGNVLAQNRLASTTERRGPEWW